MTRPRRRPWRRRVLALVALALLAALVGIGGGCTAVVRPPASVPAAHAVTIWVAKDALHRGVCLPTAAGDGFVEYGFGEWRWYAEGRDAWYRVFPTVLWPTPGTLARRRLPAADFAVVRDRLPWVEFEALTVDRRRARALREDLDARWRQQAAAAGARDEVRPWRHTFVPSGPAYWCAFNCNDALVEWLRRLDCRVRGGLLHLGVRVVSG